MRKVFLEDLPKTYKGVNWTLSIGYNIRFIYDNIEGYLKIIDYNLGAQLLKVEYLNKYFNILTSNLIGIRLGDIIGTKIKIQIGQVFKDDKRDIIITDREYRRDEKDRSQKWCKYTCNKCGWTEGWIVERNLLNNVGCSCCSGRTVVEGINDIPTTAPFMIPYFQGGYNEAKLYTKGGGGSPNNRGGNIKPICPDCGRVKDKKIRIKDIYKQGIGCTCSDKISYPNKFAYSFLDQLNEIYGFEYLEREYSPEWIGRKRYDNYFIYNGKEYILEMDGGWHKKDNKISGQTKEESKAIDDYKDLKAREHGVEVIRIDCEKSELEFIKQNILNSELCELFDLSIIDWLECEESALNNRVKETCDLWNSGIHSTKEIAEIMKLNRSTVLSYLKKGSEYKWCSFNLKELKYKKSKDIATKNQKAKNVVAMGKQIEMFKDGISLGVYSSCAELGRKGEGLFGIKLMQDGISFVCRGERKQYKGFTFKYINEIE